MADPADDKKTSSDDSVASDETLPATPGSSGSGPPVPADLSSLAVDTSDRYALMDVHAAGGLGRVLRARDRRLHRTVAVKELLQRTPAAEARFVREALITAQLEHPSIVPVHDAGRWPSGEPYYSMKLVSGRTLRELIQSRADLVSRLALVPNALAVAEAIAYAHSRGVIHRDIKPPNVLVGEFGETLVIDWGLAKDLTGRVAEPEVEVIVAAAGSGSGDLATAAGNVMGTPAYMSPEQARGEELDARADVYSLGALLYELLVGEPPHTGPSVQDVLASAQKGQAVPVRVRQPDAPSDLCAIVDKAMAPERADRYPSAVEMAADLRRFQTGQLVTARHYSRPELVLRWVARHRAIVTVAVAAAIALVVVGVVSFRRVMAQRNRAETQMHIAESRRDELIFRQAENLLERDPTAALAWLKSYPPAGARAPQLGAMIDEAVAAGVARHVLRHSDWVMRLAFAPDGRLVTLDQAGHVYSWDVATGQGGQVGHHDSEQYGELSPDGSALAIPYEDGSVEIRPIASGRSRRLVGLESEGRVRWSADGRRLVGLAPPRVRVWDTASGKALLALDDQPAQHGELSVDGSRLYIVRPNGEIAEIAVGSDRQPRIVFRLRGPASWFQRAPGGARFFVVDGEDEAQLIDLASGASRSLGRHVLRHDGWVEFSHAGDRVAITEADSTIGIHDLATGKLERTLRGHTDPVYQVAFSRDDRLLFSSSDDGTARIWSLVTDEVQVLRGHTDDVYRLAVSADGKWLATASFDETVRIWAVNTGFARVLPGTVPDADSTVFAGGGSHLLVGNRDREAETFDLATGRSTRFRGEVSEHGGPPAFGRKLAIAVDARGGATLVDVTTGVARPLPQRNSKPIFAVGISPDDARAATVDESGALLLWDVASATARPVAIERAPGRLLFLPGRREVLLAGVGFFELWDLEQGKAVLRAPLPAEQSAYRPEDLVVSADGREIVSQADDGTILAWNTTRNTVSVLEGDKVESFAVSPDGARVAFALPTREVEMWTAATGDLRMVTSHSDLVHQVAFSPDGRILASCSFDRTVRLWMVDSGRVRVLRGHGVEVKAIAFSPDGATLASVGGDGTVRLWPLAALPDDRPSAVASRLAAATTAVIDAENQVRTPAR